MSREQSLELRVLELEATIRRLEAAVETSEAAGDLIVAAAAKIVELTGERDRARATAVRLEQELARRDVVDVPSRGEAT